MKLLDLLWLPVLALCLFLIAGPVLEAPLHADEDAAEQASASDEDDESDEESDEEEEENGEDESDAEEDDDAKDDDKKKERKTHTVEPERLKINVELDGTFVAREMEEVAVRPESWSGFKIVEIVEHGTEVHEGEVLVKFDDTKINEAIAASDLDLHISELTVRRTEQELPRLEKTLKMNLDDAERSDKYAKADYERYQDVNRPLSQKSANFYVKRAESTLEYYQEELDQLEKMYEADDLTEETEEIVLKRQRDSVERAKFSLELAQNYRDEALNVYMPRRDIQVRETLDRSELQLARARMAVALDLNRARYELERMKQQRHKALEKHAKLLSDKGLMELKAPCDGVVYYGRCLGGKWSESSSLMAKLRPHNNVSSNTVVMTIVKPRPVFVMATVSEAQLPDIEKDLAARISPPPENSEKLAARIRAISAAPVSTKKFRVELELQDDPPEWLVAGMTCKVKLTVYDKKDALVVPEDAVHDDEEDEDVKYVWLVDPDDEDAEPNRRTVKLGKKKDKNVEIVDGLASGDVISLEDEDDDDDEED